MALELQKSWVVNMTNQKHTISDTPIVWSEEHKSLETFINKHEHNGNGD